MRIDLIGPSYPFRGGISHYTTLLFKSLKTKHATRFYSFKRQYPRFLIPARLADLPGHYWLIQITT